MPSIDSHTELRKKLERFFLFCFAWIVLSICIYHVLASNKYGTPDAFIFHDGWLPHDIAEAWWGLNVLDKFNGGLISPIGMPSHAPDAILGIILSKIFNLFNIHIILEFYQAALNYSAFLVIAFHSMLNLKLIVERVLGKSVGIFLLILVYVYYATSSAVTVYTNVGVFWQLTVALSFALIPSCIGDVMQIALLDRKDNKIIISFGTKLGIILLGLNFYLPLFIAIAPYILVSCQSYKNTLSIVIKSLAISSAIGLPMVFGILLLTGNFIGDTSASVQVNGMYGAIKGGVSNVFLQRSYWPLYTIWSPRSISEYYSIYSNKVYLTAVIFLTISLFYIAIRQKCKHFSGVVLSLLVVAFFTKGGSEPFGEIFGFIQNHFAPFSLIRTPDSKLSILYTAMFSVLIISASAVVTNFVRYIIAGILLIVISFNFKPIVDGHAYFGVADTRSYSVILDIDEIFVINKLSKIPSGTNVLIYPPKFFNLYNRNTGFYDYAEPLTKFLDLNFYQDDRALETPKNFQSVLDDLAVHEDSSLAALRISYIVIRKNLIRNEDLISTNIFVANLPGKYKKIYSGQNLDLYENSEGLLGGSNFDSECRSIQNGYNLLPNLCFTNKAIKNSYLEFYSNYPHGWFALTLNENNFVLLKPVSKTKNDDFSSNVSFDLSDGSTFIFFLPELLFSLCILISVIMLLSCLYFLLKGPAKDE